MSRSVDAPLAPLPASGSAAISATAPAASASGAIDVPVPVSSGAPRAAALLIGINYLANRAYKLFGCCNDARAVGRYLIDHAGFPAQGVKVVTDEDPTTAHGTTRVGIVAGIRELGEASWRDNLDRVLIHYSGHGSQQAALDRTSEADGMDETIVPSDSCSAGCITDNELHALLLKFNPRTHIYCTFDSCHSGSILDLPFSYSPITGAVPQCDAKIEVASDTVPRIVLLSGCCDSQLSADAWDDESRQARGALTSAMLSVLLHSPSGVTARDLQLRALVDMRTKGYTQQSVLSSNFLCDREPWLGHA
jgi:hypothetical protein